jgi:hypothetical protein
MKSNNRKMNRAKPAGKTKRGASLDGWRCTLRHMSIKIKKIIGRSEVVLRPI